MFTKLSSGSGRWTNVHITPVEPGPHSQSDHLHGTESADIKTLTLPNVIGEDRAMNDQNPLEGVEGEKTEKPRDELLPTVTVVSGDSQVEGREEDKRPDFDTVLTALLDGSLVGVETISVLYEDTCTGPFHQPEDIVDKQTDGHSVENLGSEIKHLNFEATSHQNDINHSVEDSSHTTESDSNSDRASESVKQAVLVGPDHSETEQTSGSLYQESSSLYCESD